MKLIYKGRYYFRGIHRFKRKMLTLDEVNERIHRYLPNLDCIEYNGTAKPAVLYCKVCKTQFTTRDRINPYMYGIRFCCPNCKELKYINECKELLKKSNKKFITTLSRYSSGERLVQYECLLCGTIGTTSKGDLIKGYGSCTKCGIRAKRIQNSLDRMKLKGQYLIDWKSASEITVMHIFCGNKRKAAVRNVKINNLCAKCKSKLTKGKQKENNKHLVQETEELLKTTLTIRNMMLERNPKFLETNKNEWIKFIFEYIEPWYNNFIYIKENYPNGDLGSVIEQNELYNKLKETVESWIN